jgi:hypothetical protein
VHAMNAALISDECDHNQNEHYDEDDALFIFGEFENSEQTFHCLVTQLWCLWHITFFVGVLQSCHSERSEESQIILLYALSKPIARDVSLCST